MPYSDVADTRCFKIKYLVVVDRNSQRQIK